MTSSWCNNMDLSLNSPQKCEVWQHFWLCHIWVMWWRCVIPCFIFYFCGSFKFTNSNRKNTESNPQPPLLPHSLVRRNHKKAATTAMMAMDTAGHCGSNFSHDSPFWLLRLDWWVPPPSNKAGLFDCCQGQFLILDSTFQ